MRFSSAGLINPWLFFCSSDIGKEKDTGSQDHSLAIGIPVGFGVVIVIAVFIVITITNRRFFAGHMRQNALYVGSVVAEHCVSTDIYRPEQPTSSDSYNDIYSVVNTIRRPNVSNLAFWKKENEWNWKIKCSKQRLLFIIIVEKWPYVDSILKIKTQWSIRLYYKFLIA